MILFVGQDQSWAKIGTAVPRDFGTAPRPVPTGFFGTGGTFFYRSGYYFESILSLFCTI